MARLALAALLLAGCAAPDVPVGSAAPGMRRETMAGASRPLHTGKARSRRGLLSPASRDLPGRRPLVALFQRLAMCESGGNWHINTGNSYFGGVQMTLSFWRSYGGLRFASRPDFASELEQITVAERGLAAQGWNAWPVCSVVTGAAS